MNTDLCNELIDTAIATALKEDSGNIGDVSALSTIPEDSKSTAVFLAKADGVVSGIEIAQRVFDAVLDGTVKVSFDVKDGDFVTTGTRFGTAVGSTRCILAGERIILNLMQRMSGIATHTHSLVKLIGSNPMKLLDTRKTVPGLRVLDKMAVVHGGGVNHRIGLFDMVMLKDNHIMAAGGIPQALDRTWTYLKSLPNGADIPIEVETRTLDEVKEVLECSTKGRVDRIMLDNMVVKTDAGYDTSMLEEALKLIQHKIPAEASGNITSASLAQVAATGCEYASVGALTHSVTALDISLKIQQG
eukprot:GFYU01001414.1.p1 GENE.GFYU01001414.1~~GFYU01001414.1.p1  ORF type:complete len:302 (-),score=82.07 GFYU01001414.1:370-1275(-)